MVSHIRPLTCAYFFATMSRNPEWLKYENLNRTPQGTSEKNDEFGLVIKPDVPIDSVDLIPRKFRERGALPGKLGLNLNRGSLAEVEAKNELDAQYRERAEKLKQDTLSQPSINTALSALFPRFNRPDQEFVAAPPTPDTTMTYIHSAPTMSMTGRLISPQLLPGAVKGNVVVLDERALEDLANQVYPRSIVVRRLVTIVKRANVLLPSVIHDPGQVTELTFEFEHNVPSSSDADTLAFNSNSLSKKTYRVYVESLPVTFERIRLKQKTEPYRMPPRQFSSEAPRSIKIQVSVPEPITGTRRTYVIDYDDALAQRDVPLEDIAEDAAGSARPAVPMRRSPYFRSVAADATDNVMLEMREMPIWALVVLVVGTLTLGYVMAFFIHKK